MYYIYYNIIILKVILIIIVVGDDNERYLCQKTEGRFFVVDTSVSVGVVAAYTFPYKIIDKREKHFNFFDSRW